MAANPTRKFLPECDLIQNLIDKAAQRSDIQFDFIGKLNDFRERVSGEVRQINLLFPEYTPHDEEYHLSRLFHVASLLLGRDRLSAMNSAELFILAVSLYGHDWGMAVSELEKDYILGENKSTSDHNFSLLPDEKSRFAKFLKKHGVQLNNGDKKDISIELWREYVRQTHAERSGERVRKYFENISGGIADAAARVCVGHWLDFEDLEDYHLYPQDFSVLRESVNLRALAVYMRLIDLLDLSEDRTPYVIWKFVAPRDPKSKMEWAKHRALHPITCPSYQQGRIIQVDGSTDDHEVYAALEDLRIWCDEQLRGCNDVLARMNDDRHKLDIYHIDWRVGARGFKPVLVQFEFDRERMFEILGDDIYQSDPYVFLRELLQNSIDAIRVRREILRRKGFEPRNIGVIRVDVEHKENCDATITWTDDGIGMDEFVLRNYFAVAGRSYYRSADFEREGLNIDPISRFGIGFLSCFMVSDRVEIETYREPYSPPPSDPLRITIPAVRRQFRIETFSPESATVGTKIQVYVVGNKLPKNEISKLPEALDVTSYLCTIAGFVEFPIVIHEGKQRTIILHPNQDPQLMLERLGKGYQIHQIDLAFPWDDAIFPQDLYLAQEDLENIELELSVDLDLDKYEGKLTYLVPKTKSAVFEANRTRGGSIIINGKEIRWNDSWESYYGRGGSVRENASRSAMLSKAYAVYRDGILVAMAENPRYRTSDYFLALPTPKLIANIPKIGSPKINLARTELLDNKDDAWFKPILQSHFDQIIGRSLQDLLSKNELDRLYDLGYLTVFHHNEAKYLWKTFPNSHIPIPFLKGEPIVEAINCHEMVEKTVLSLIQLPRYLRNELTTLLNNLLVHKTEYKGYLKEWVGNPSCFAIENSSFIVLDGMSNLYMYALRQSHRVDSVDFLKPISNKFPPLVQGVFGPVEIPRELLDLDLAELSNKFRTYISSLNPEELQLLLRVFTKAYENPSILNNIEIDIINRIKESEIFPEFTKFQKPHEKAFGYGLSIINLNHHLGKAILQVYAWIAIGRIQKSISTDKLGILQDRLYKVLSTDEVYIGGLLSMKGYKMKCNALKDLWLAVQQMGLTEINMDTINKYPTPTIEEFISKTIFDPDKFPWSTYLGERRVRTTQPFGDALT